MTLGERSAFIEDVNPCQFYCEALRIKVTKAAALSRAIATVQSDPSTEQPKYYDWCEKKQDYIAVLSVEQEKSSYQLIVFLNVFKELLKSVRVATRLDLLSQEELQALHIKLQAVAVYYPDAYYSSHGESGPEKYLLDPASDSWW